MKLKKSIIVIIRIVELITETKKEKRNTMQIRTIIREVLKSNLQRVYVPFFFV